MRLKITKSAKSTRLYAIKSTYDPKTGKTSSKVVEKIGSAEEIMEREGVDYDGAIEWAKEYIDQMTRAEESARTSSLIRFDSQSLIEKDVRRRVGVGHLFAEYVCSELGLGDACKEAIKQTKCEYDIAAIAQMLVCGRIISPASKRSTFEWSRDIVDAPDISQHQIYRAIEQMGIHVDEIQAKLYRSSAHICSRDDTLLYYDCTNFYFETEEEDEEGGLRQYGVSKENRPNPIVQMGLFMDGSGMPLAFSIWPGNTSEQITMTPLEQTILDRFNHSKFITVTDAGLSSASNRSFNTQGGRAYITATSVKKLDKHLKQWALEKSGWHIEGKDGVFNLDECEEHAYDTFFETLFYKERMVKSKDGLEEKLIVTFSFKYQDYLASLRDRHLSRAQKKVDAGAKAATRKRATDPDRFVSIDAVTETGEVAETLVVSVDGEKAAKEAIYDGFYAVATSLVDETDISAILKINRNRWEIEECFRIMKTDFCGRPVYVSRENRIKGHFLTCFTALLVYRIIEARLGNKYSTSQLLNTMREMDMLELAAEGWIPAYKRTDITDALHEAFGFRTDTEIVTNRQMRTILAKVRNPKAKITK